MTSVTLRAKIGSFLKNPVGRFAVQAGFWISLINILVYVFGVLHLFTPDPPGWTCDPVDLHKKDNSHNCRPLPGWHFEKLDDGTPVAIHDNSDTPAKRRQDFDTAKYWGKLKDDQRDKILHYEATIYDFVPRPK